MEGKTNFSRCLKQFDGWTWVIPAPHILRQIHATDIMSKFYSKFAVNAAPRADYFRTKHYLFSVSISAFGLLF